MSSTAQDRSSKEEDLEEIFNLDPAVLKQLLDQLLEPRQHNLVEEPPQHNLVDVDSQTIDEAIQNLPPEIHEIIYKEYVAIKQRERANLGWNKLHEDILKKPFSDYMQQIVPDILCMECMHGRFGGCCYPCWNSDELRGYECYKRREIHYLDFPYNENSQKFY